MSDQLESSYHHKQRLENVERERRILERENQVLRLRLERYRHRQELVELERKRAQGTAPTSGDERALKNLLNDKLFQACNDWIIQNNANIIFEKNVAERLLRESIQQYVARNWATSLVENYVIEAPDNPAVIKSTAAADSDGADASPDTAIANQGAPKANANGAPGTQSEQTKFKIEEPDAALVQDALNHFFDYRNSALDAEGGAYERQKGPLGLAGKNRRERVWLKLQSISGPVPFVVVALVAMTLLVTGFLMKEVGTGLRVVVCLSLLLVLIASVLLGLLNHMLRKNNTGDKSSKQSEDQVEHEQSPGPVAPVDIRASSSPEKGGGHNENAQTSTGTSGTDRPSPRNGTGTMGSRERIQKAFNELLVPDADRRITLLKHQAIGALTKGTLSKSDLANERRHYVLHESLAKASQYITKATGLFMIATMIVGVFQLFYAVSFALHCDVVLTRAVEVVETNAGSLTNYLFPSDDKSGEDKNKPKKDEDTATRDGSEAKEDEGKANPPPEVFGSHSHIADRVPNNHPASEGGPAAPANKSGAGGKKSHGISDFMHHALTSLEIILLAPLPYLLMVGLSRYVKALAFRERVDEFRRELLDFKSFEVALFIAIVAAATVARVLREGDQFEWRHAGAAAIVIIVLAGYFFVIEWRAGEDEKLELKRELIRHKIEHGHVPPISHVPHNSNAPDNHDTGGTSGSR